MTFSCCLTKTIGLALALQSTRKLVIQAKKSAEFKHEGDPTAQSSKGGVAYAVENGITWVIAWSNLSSENNKVYIDITKEVVDWSILPSTLLV
ncbi:hypothetical protein V6N11_055217 [Hibiscus sabdariffa]|uniref:Uncharacterized protein n=2 Tax=Hibiscus sabdariffa TaxID=183260 RepID=A0ABR2PEM9_9ROSI